jgi:peptide/nickel transport system permease protein
VIAPDNTENANLQIPQLALQYPFSRLKFFKEEISDKPTSAAKQILFGKKSKYKYHPIDSLKKSDDYVELYFGKRTQLLKINEGDQMNDHIENRFFLLGTDKYGRDIFSRLLVGLRVSLLVGFFAVIISLLLGIFFGLISGYFGGWQDRLIMMIINVNWSIPTLLLAFAILLVLEKGLFAIFLAIGFTLWVDLARVIRGQVMEIKNKTYVVAAKTMGFSPSRIMLRHILPNLTGIILVIASINFATAILVEAGLSYLGLGVQPPVPSLGNMLKENYGYATSGYLTLSVAPALFILVLVLSFNLLGNGLRDYFDIKR